MSPDAETLDDRHIVLMWRARWWLITVEDADIRPADTRIDVWVEEDDE